jgi:UDP-glucose 4-epimerase
MLPVVFGAKGYLGSFVVSELWKSGYDPICFEINTMSGAQRIGNRETIVYPDTEIYRLEQFKDVPIYVFHCAGAGHVSSSDSEVDVSQANFVLINQLSRISISAQMHLVFASTLRGTEQNIISSADPYVRIKRESEILLKSLPFRQHTVVRLSNLAGQDRTTGLLEAHEPETHFIPNACRSVSLSLPLHVPASPPDQFLAATFRDFIHVKDAARAMIVLAKALRSSCSETQFNVCTGSPNSLMEVVKIIETRTRRNLTILGGSARLEASFIPDYKPSKRLQELGWNPTFSLEEIIDSYL